MKKIFLITVVFLTFIVLASKTAWAAYLTLTRIGTLSTAGLNYSTYTVTGAVPDFSGTATPSALVAVTVNAVTATTSANLSGVWAVIPNNIVTGNNSVSIASGNEVISFILSYTPSAIPTPTLTPEIATVSSLPKSGGYTWPLVIVLTGVGVFLVGRKIRGKVEDEWNI